MISVLCINHFGSTVVHDLVSKPIMDILLEESNQTKIEITYALFSNMKKYKVSKQEDRFHNQDLLCLKGFSISGFLERVFHIHIR